MRSITSTRHLFTAGILSRIVFLIIFTGILSSPLSTSHAQNIEIGMPFPDCEPWYILQGYYSASGWSHEGAIALDLIKGDPLDDSQTGLATVVAPMSGTIYKFELSPAGRGWGVRIVNGSYTFRLYHLEEPTINWVQQINKGDPIGQVFNTSLGGWKHLHIQLEIDGQGSLFDIPGTAWHLPEVGDRGIGAGMWAGTELRSGCTQSLDVRSDDLTPLRLYWNAARADNFTTSTLAGETAAKQSGYTLVRTEGFAFNTQLPGTTPLELYWSSERGDNFVTATPEGKAQAIAAGYVFVRIEGYVYATQQIGTIPLKLYWSNERGDNFTTATLVGEQSAQNAAYSFARIEGYILEARPLNLYWGFDRGDNFTTGTIIGEASALAAGYVFVRTEGYALTQPIVGTVPLQLYWSNERGDNFTTSTDIGKQSAIDAGYTLVRTEGYIFPSATPNTTPLYLYWSGGRADNFTTATQSGRSDAQAAQYSEVRTEGYVYPSAPPLAAPNLNTPSGNGSTTVGLTWSQIQDAIKYMVHIIKRGSISTLSNANGTTTIMTTATSITVSEPGNYSIIIRSCNDEGCSSVSGSVGITVLPNTRTRVFIPLIKK